jgi:hypothetical protein
MPRRKETDTVQLGLRVKEPLRAALEQAAQASGLSMNAEIVKRLETSFLRLDRDSLAEAGGQLIRSGAALQGILNRASALARSLRDDKARAEAVMLVLDLAEMQGKLYEPIGTLMMAQPNAEQAE